MNSILAFDFSVDKENRKITVKREFAAERSLVWDAFTRSELLDQWWAPRPWRSQTKSMDFREGGIRRYAMVSPEGEMHWSIMEYKTIEKPDRFTYMDGFTDGAGTLNTEMPRMNWELNFLDKGEITEVDIRITLDDLSQMEAILKMGFQGGFTMCLQNLDEVLTAEKVNS